MRPSFLRIVTLLSVVILIAILTWPLHPALAQNSSQTPKVDQMTERFIIIYKSCASDADKEKLRSKLKAKVTERFSDPAMEEVTIEIPKSDDPKTFTNKLLTTAKKNRAVQSMQPVAQYKLD
jgi:hypothetical protein